MVIAQEPTQSLPALNRLRLVGDIRITREQQDVSLALMIPLDMIMFDEFVQCPPQRALAQEDHFGQALLLHRPNPALRKGIRVRTAGRQRQRFDLTRGNDGPERPSVFGVPIVQEIATVPQDAASLHGHIAGHLLHPQLVWVNGDSRDVHPAAIKVDEEQHVVGHQSTQREHFGGEKVGPCQQRQVGPNEGRPCGRALALRCRRQTVALQDIADRLIADLIPQIGQRPSDPVIAPGAVLLGHANDALLDLAPDPRSAWAATGFRAIELAGDKLAVPAQDGVWPRHLATSARTLRPRRWPISPSVARSVSESLGRPFSLAVRMRFSAARYSFSASSSWSTVPVTQASIRDQSIPAPLQPPSTMPNDHPQP